MTCNATLANSEPIWASLSLSSGGLMVVFPYCTLKAENRCGMNCSYLYDPNVPLEFPPRVPSSTLVLSGFSEADSVLAHSI